MDINWLNYYTGPNIPTLLIRIGPMGSGKTSAVNIFIEKHLKFLEEYKFSKLIIVLVLIIVLILLN